MAIRELFSLVQNQIPISRMDTDGTANDIHAGQCVGRVANASTHKVPVGSAVLAYREAIDAGTMTFAGLAYDDAARNSNTFIQPDPVGSTKVSADGDTFTANNNAFFTSTKRALADYQDETISNVSNLVEGATGYQGPRRGLGYFAYTPGTQFIIDALGIVYDKTTSAVNAEETDATLVVGDRLTIASTNNKGKLVPCTIDNIAHAPTVGHIAQVDAISGSGAGILVTITMI